MKEWKDVSDRVKADLIAWLEGQVNFWEGHHPDSEIVAAGYAMLTFLKVAREKEETDPKGGVESLQRENEQLRKKLDKMREVIEAARDVDLILYMGDDSDARCQEILHQKLRNLLDQKFRYKK